MGDLIGGGAHAASHLFHVGAGILHDLTAMFGEAARSPGDRDRFGDTMMDFSYALANRFHRACGMRHRILLLLGELPSVLRRQGDLGGGIA